MSKWHMERQKFNKPKSYSLDRFEQDERSKKRFKKRCSWKFFWPYMRTLDFQTFLKSCTKLGECLHVSKYFCLENISIHFDSLGNYTRKSSSERLATTRYLKGRMVNYQLEKSLTFWQKIIQLQKPSGLFDIPREIHGKLIYSKKLRFSGLF